MRREDRDRDIKIIGRISGEGLLINPDALQALRSERNRNVLEEAIERSIRAAKEEGTKIIEERHVRLSLSLVRSIGSMEIGATKVVPLGKEYESNVELIYSPPSVSYVDDSVQSKTRHFRNRFEKLAAIIRRRPDFASAYTVREILRSPSPGPFKTIVMVARKGRGNFIVEDLEEEMTLNIPKNAKKIVIDSFHDLVTDIVVGIEVTRHRDALFATDIILPQIPDTPVRKIREPISTLLLSDLHVGSKYFMEKDFLRVIEWLSKVEGGSSISSVAASAKYLIIAGDVIDGVFVYPGQERELDIVEVEKQYRRASQILAKIPEYIHVIVAPGNHDIVRKGLPQPPIPTEYLKELADERGNVTLVGNPAVISLHGVRFVVYHGQSLEDVASYVAKVEYSKPQVGMEYLLSVRHLAPIYGDNTQIALADNDDLVIGDKPDVFHAGHVHIFGKSEYRGTRIVNSGTWQQQTPYQNSLRIMPTPGTFAAYLMNDARVLPLGLSDIEYA